MKKKPFGTLALITVFQNDQRFQIPTNLKNMDENTSIFYYMSRQDFEIGREELKRFITSCGFEYIGEKIRKRYVKIEFKKVV